MATLFHIQHSSQILLNVHSYTINTQTHQLYAHTFLLRSQNLPSQDNQSSIYVCSTGPFPFFPLSCPEKSAHQHMPGKKLEQQADVLDRLPPNPQHPHTHTHSHKTIRTTVHVSEPFKFLPRMLCPHRGRMASIYPLSLPETNIPITPPTRLYTCPPPSSPPKRNISATYQPTALQIYKPPLYLRSSARPPVPSILLFETRVRMIHD